MLKRLLPHPYLTLTLVGVWLALNNSVSLGAVVFGTILGVVIPIITAAFWPGRPRIDLLRAAGYFAVVLWDIVVANITVARIVLFMPRAALRSTWVVVPLDLRSPEAITMLAGTITMTPGTVSAEFSEDGRAILVHCLHAPDPESVVAEIKSRYERRLKEIFE